MAKLIPLRGKHGKGKFAIVDDADYDLVSKYKWRCSDKGYAVYGIYDENGDFLRLIAMHQLILPPKKGFITDHENHNRLDNRRLNLRYATRMQNATNARPRTDGTSRYKGVNWNKNSQKWHARIGYNNEVIHLGFYATEEEAARAYDVPTTLTIADDNITLLGYGATLDASDLDNDTALQNPTIYALSKHGISIIGLRLIGPDVEGSLNTPAEAANSVGIYLVTSNNCIVRDCRIEGYFRGGIYLQGNNHSIIGNHLHHVRYRPAEMGSIFLSANEGSVVSGNVITGVWGSGIAAQNSYHCTISGNFIEGEDWADPDWLEVQSMGIVCYNIKHFSITGNVIRRITDEGIAIVTGSNTTEASFNTITGNVMYNCHLRGVNLRAITGTGFDTEPHYAQYNVVSGNVVIIDDTVPGGAVMDCAYMIETDTLLSANNFAIGNIFSNNIAVGIDNTITKGFYCTGAQISRTLVTGNTFRNCVTGLHIGGADSLVADNACYDCTVGIAVASNTSTSVIQSNIVVGSVTDSIQLSGAMTRTQIVRNLIDKKVNTSAATGSSWWIGENMRSDAVSSHGIGTLVAGVATVNNSVFSATNSECIVEVFRLTHASTPANTGGLFVSLRDPTNSLIQVKSTNALDDGTFWWRILR